MSWEGSELTPHMAAQPGDERLRAAILAALTADPQTAACALRVGVLNGIAHLGGAAATAEVWAAAGRIAAAVPGVRGVVNRIEAPGAPCPARAVNLDLPAISEGENRS